MEGGGGDWEKGEFLVELFLTENDCEDRVRDSVVRLEDGDAFLLPEEVGVFVAFREEAERGDLEEGEREDLGTGGETREEDVYLELVGDVESALEPLPES